MDHRTCVRGALGFLAAVLLLLTPLRYLLDGVEGAGGAPGRSDSARAFTTSAFSLLAAAAAAAGVACALYSERHQHLHRALHPHALSTAGICACLAALAIASDISILPIAGGSHMGYLYAAHAFSTACASGGPNSPTTSHLPSAILLLAAAWAVVSLGSRGFRFALHDGGPTSGFTALPTTGDHAAVMCGCGTPPCPGMVSAGLSVAVSHLVGIVSLWALSKSCQASKEDCDKLSAGASLVCQKVIEFDLDAAEQALAAFASAPPELRGTLLLLIGRVKAYKAFLPRAFIPTRCESQEGVAKFTTLRRETQRRKTAIVNEDPAEPMTPCLGAGFSAFASEASIVVPPSPGVMVFDADVQSSSSGRSSQRSSRFMRPVPLKLEGLEASCTSSSEGVLSIVDGVGTPARSASFQRVEPKSVTLVHCNMRGSLARMSSLPESFLSSHVRVLQAAINVSRLFRGVVDDFLGDRIMVSFNASIPCSGHASAATDFSLELYAQAASSATPVDLSVGIAQGPAFCGQLGCGEMLRYSLYGELPLAVNCIERVARTTSGIVCDASVRLQVCSTHELRLLLKRYFLHIGDEQRRHLLWEVMYNTSQQREGAAPSSNVVDMEWMYELDKVSAKWDLYNRAARFYLTSDSGCDEALEVLRHMEENPPPIGEQAFAELRRVVTSPDVPEVEVMAM